MRLTSLAAPFIGATEAKLPLGKSLDKAALDKVNAIEGSKTSMLGKYYEVIAGHLHEAIGLKVGGKN